MRIIPVIDLQGGQVVRAVAGDRARYQAVQSVFADDARPETVARGLVDRFGFRVAYIADLDAIAGRDSNLPALQGIADAGLKLLIDAGVRGPEQAQRLLAWEGAEGWIEGLVVGLESVDGREALASSFRTLGARRAVFSLDLKHGRPVTSVSAWWGLAAEAIADVAVEAGFSRLIVLDLARVGAGCGTGQESLCRSLRARHPGLELLAGGGVRGPGDLRRLDEAGCDAALVASALHDGRLTRADLAEWQ
jgi:phosphoribosylformimino-5-aminoimidazole carboxamide ribotide isomerase